MGVCNSNGHQHGGCLVVVVPRSQKDGGIASDLSDVV